MPQVDVNWLAIIVCAVVSMVIGFIWYSMPVFGKPWMEAAGLSMDKIKSGPSTGYAVSVIAALIAAYVMSHFVVYTQSSTATDGALTGFWVWVGFTLTSMAMNTVFEMKPAKLLYINAGMQLVNLMVIGAILAVWR